MITIDRMTVAFTIVHRIELYFESTDSLYDRISDFKESICCSTLDDARNIGIESGKL
ncbi:MAG: hypothetical protein OXF08_10530 [Bacteroidetes bacterium]|nr:hypothetical protein [Bacteroidota bacterium]